MAILLQLIMSTFLMWKTQRNIDCNTQVFCFLINKLHARLSEGAGVISEDYEEDGWSIFLKTSVINLVDKNEDRKVSLGELREISVEYLREVFALFDANDDGYLEASESSLSNISYSKAWDAFFLVFKIFDQDQDNVISSYDLPNMDSFDTNLDGDITLVEILQAATGQQIPNLIFLPRPFQTLIKKLDPSLDEEISISEYEDFVSKLFNAVDDDNDCSVSLDEVLEVIGGNKVAVKQVLKPYTNSVEIFIKKLIKKGDSNFDGQMDLYEIIDFGDFKFLSESLHTFKQLDYPKFNRSSRSQWTSILQIKDDISVWLTLADRFLQREEFNNKSKC